VSNEKQGSQAGSPRRRGWGRIALIVSLALNLLFIGAAGGSMWARWAGYWGGPGGHNPFAGAIHDLMRALPPERREAAREVLRRHRGEIWTARGEMRKARRDAARAMRQDPFDEAAFRAALAEMGKADVKLRESVGEIAVDLGKTLTLEERRELLRGLARRGHFGRGHRRHGGPGRAEDGADEDLDAGPGVADDAAPPPPGP